MEQNGRTKNQGTENQGSEPQGFFPGAGLENTALSTITRRQAGSGVRGGA